MKKFTVYPNNYVKSSKIIGASNDQDFEIDENLVTESDILNAIKRLKKENMEMENLLLGMAQLDTLLMKMTLDSTQSCQSLQTQ